MSDASHPIAPLGSLGAGLLLLAALVFLAGAAPARADGEILKIITPADRARLDAYDVVKAEALAEARAEGSAADVATLDEIVSRPSLPFEGFDMTGTWQCRTIKAGGLARLVVYGWFRCRVTDDGSGWRLEKLTGSQRTTGRLFDDGADRLIYLGSLHVNEEKAPAYASGPDSDQAGYAFRTGPRQWRIEFPSPRYESKLDILELKR